MKRWIGTDESGKGDYFGGLVVAGVMVDEDIVSKLKEIGVRDSKKLSDSRIEFLSESIQKLCPHSVVSIGSQKYNELYSKLHNLNRILAWAHARVIENLLGGASASGGHVYPGGSRCGLVVADKFGDKRYIEHALMEKGKQIKLEQREHAESDPGVAAASILARARFLKELKKIGTQIGTQLPKGAGDKVEEVARDLIKKHGNEVLERVAKVHFKTSHKIKEILRGVYPERKEILHFVQNDRRGQNDKVRENDRRGEGDRLERIWAPWRAKYISSLPVEAEPKSRAIGKAECIFCKAINKKDKEALVLERGEKAFVVMNIFPYNNGHVMIAPYRHIGVPEELTQEEASSLFRLVQKSVRVLKKQMNPNGFNIGMNLGKVAGAGVADHIHIHIVPRWAGDTNFMPIISDTKIISQSLKETYKLLKKGFAKT